MQPEILFHGTNGDNILAIINSGLMKPGVDGKIFFARYSWPSALMHGPDSRRRASCVIKVSVQIPQGAVREYAVTDGVKDTLIVHTTKPLATEVIEMHIRQAGQDGEPYTFSHLKSIDAIVGWLNRPTK